MVREFPSKEDLINALSVLSRAKVIDDYSYQCVTDNIEELD